MMQRGRTALLHGFWVVLIVAVLAVPSSGADAVSVMGSSKWDPWYQTHENKTFWVLGIVKGTPATFKVEAHFEKHHVWGWDDVDFRRRTSPFTTVDWYYDTIEGTFVAYEVGTYRITQELYVRWNNEWVFLADHQSREWKLHD